MPPVRPLQRTPPASRLFRVLKQMGVRSAKQSGALSPKTTVYSPILWGVYPKKAL